MLARFQAQWRLKLVLTATMNALFWGGYGYLGRHASFPLHVPPLTWIDRVIPFQPAFWSWVYLSEFLLAAILPWLIDTREGLLRYASGVAVMTVVSFGVFWLLPVASPRPNQTIVAGAMGFIAAADGRFNAFPSLHAAFLAYLALLAHRLWPRASWAATAGGVVWAGAILYATIATRQHYALDLVAGAAVGVLADWLAWSGKFGASAAMMTSRNSAVASHEGAR